MCRFLLLVLVATAGCASKTTSEPTGLAAGVLLVGRFTREEEPRFAWSGSALSARFRGPSLAVELDERGDGQHYAVIVDGEVVRELVTAAGRRTYALAEALPAGEHTLTLYRQTEAALGETTFGGFLPAPGGALLSPPAPRARRVLLVGDSISAGYGNEGSSESCPFTPATENHYLSYGALAARALAAELTSVAWSGKGVVSNRGRGGATMAELWPRLLPDEGGAADDGHLDVIWVNLGTNDLASEVADWSRFGPGYLALVRQLRARHPGVTIFCLLGPMLSETWPEERPALPVARQAIRAAVDQLRGEGDLRVHFLELPAQDGSLGYGCDYHPNLATHRAMAERVVAAMRAELAW